MLDDILNVLNSQVIAKTFSFRWLLINSVLLVYFVLTDKKTIHEHHLWVAQVNCKRKNESKDEEELKCDVINQTV